LRTPKIGTADKNSVNESVKEKANAPKRKSSKRGYLSSTQNIKDDIQCMMQVVVAPSL
jgi:hypothetical protein